MTAIREYRKKQNMTQAELAKIVGVVPSTITQYETGVRKPDIIVLKKIATALSVTTDKLLKPVNAEINKT